MNFDWVLDPPRETFERFQTQRIDPPLLAGVLASALLSGALADAFMVPETVRHLPLVLISNGLAFALIVGLFFQLSRLFGSVHFRFEIWLRAGILALIPLHLALPAALLCKPMGTGGFVFYEVFKLGILFCVVRRTVWAVQSLNHWPAWASAIFLMGPFLLTLMVLFSLTLVGLLLLGVSLWSI